MARDLMAELPRIYFDTNEGGGDTFFLDIPGSLKDICRLGDSLRPGIRVLLYMTDELEVEANLEYDPEYKRWIGRTDWSTIRYLQ
jgi:hypothetical protein